MLIAAIGLWFATFATFEDNSCLSATYAVTETGEVCRVSALEAYCPDPSGPCLAREAKWEAFKSTPLCQPRPVRRTARPDSNH